MRLFIGINFHEHVKNILSDNIAELKKSALKGNFTRRENLHLTIVFIGETNKVEDVKSVMDEIQTAPFDLAIGGLGRFKRDGGDLYWAGVEGNSILREIYNQLLNGLTKRGFMIEKRGFKPHLTLGREVVLPEIFDEKEFADRMPYIFITVNRISLMKSERINGKLTYTEIYGKEF